MPIKHLKVELICGICNDLDDPELPLMELEGNLYFNPANRSQTQRYKCKYCDNQISVTITPE